jgi:uncharacterized protein (DUF2236 family)
MPSPIVGRDDLERSLEELTREVSDPRAGILGPRSIAWRLGGDLAVFAGGGRAALLQLAHPFVAHAIADHSSTRTDVVGRFQRTFRHIFAMVFGELPDALAAARRVHAVHSRIHGTLPDGTAYHANDPHALHWVHATLVDTVVVVRERLDGPLPLADKDGYAREMNRLAALFGIPRALLPASWAEHAAYVERMLGGRELAVAPLAREMAMFLVGRGGPGPQPPLGRAVEAVTASLLPRHLARAFGLRANSIAVHAVTAAIAPVYNALPRRAIAIPAHAEAARRLAGKPPSRLGAWTERRLFGLSKRVTG